MLRTYNEKSIDMLRHRQNNAIWNLIALAIGEKIVKAVYPALDATTLLCYNSLNSLQLLIYLNASLPLS